jgi:hypothetical protein
MHARPTPDGGEKRLGVCHLRHLPRMHEGGDLDAAEAGIGQGLDQRGAVGQREEPALDLEAFARPFLTKGDAGGSVAAHACSS